MEMTKKRFMPLIIILGIGIFSFLWTELIANYPVKTLIILLIITGSLQMMKKLRRK